ncbi:MAG: ABC transporter permease, partial [Desulfurococcales archaeon ex4484_58]
MRGLGRVVVVTIINFIIVFVIVAIIMASVFSIFAYRQLKAIVQEIYTAQARQLEQRMAKASPEAVEKAKEKLNYTLWKKYGLLQPVHERILLYTFNLITFNLSFPLLPDVKYPLPGNDALELTLNALVRTAILFTTATVINIVISLFLGLQAAKRAGSLFDRALAIIALISYSLPMWWTGLLLIMLFSFHLRLLPYRAIGVFSAIESLNKKLEMGQINYAEYLGGYIFEWIRYLALPIMTYLLVAFGGASYITR